MRKVACYGKIVDYRVASELMFDFRIGDSFPTVHLQQRSHEMNEIVLSHLFDRAVFYWLIDSLKSRDLCLVRCACTGAQEVTFILPSGEKKKRPFAGAQVISGPAIKFRRTFGRCCARLY